VLLAQPVVCGLDFAVGNLHDDVKDLPKNIKQLIKSLASIGQIDVYPGPKVANPVFIVNVLMTQVSKLLR